jgi:hypothetical protein
MRMATSHTFFQSVYVGAVSLVERTIAGSSFHLIIPELNFLHVKKGYDVAAGDPPIFCVEVSETGYI